MVDAKSILAKLSYHAVYDESILDALNWAADNGFSGVQLAVQVPHFQVLGLARSECKKIRDILERKNLRLTLHAHDDNVSLLETDTSLRQGILDYYGRLIETAHRLTTEIVTIHLGAPPTFPTDDETALQYPMNDLQGWQAAATASLEELVALTTAGPLICIENVNLSPLVREVLQPFLDSKRLGLCWDIAKSEADTKLEAYLRRNLAHIKQVHLHDIDDAGRSHRIIGTGRIDFRSYLEDLSKVNVLDYCIEVRPRESAKASLDRLKMMLADRPG